MSKEKMVFFIILLCSAVCLAIYGSAPLYLPSSTPLSIPVDEFSAERAMQHVQALAQYPRIVGRPGMKQAAEYLIAALHSCQLEPEIQQVPSRKGTLQNVMVRIAGENPGNALLLVTHTDSVSYGAGDNATGVAVLLEAGCSLNATGKFNNDIIMLFEDGEEQGYLGGYAFAKSDPSIETIRGVIAMDTAAWGPVVLLQTTPENEAFIRAYGESVDNPVAFSFFADADWNISRDNSEIQPFYEIGIQGIDFEDPTAFSGKHSDTDTTEYIKIGSLQKMGDQVVALARYMADTNLVSQSKSQLSYFSLWGIGLVRYPATWNLVFSILASIGFIALVMRQTKQSAFTYKSISISTLFIFLTFVGVVCFTLIAGMAFEKIFPNPNPNIDSYLIPASLPFFLGVLVLVGFGYISLRRIITKQFGRAAGNDAGLLCWLLLSIVSAILLQAGSYLFTIPILIAVLISLLPDELQYLWVLPAAASTVLSFPNLVLAYLGTGMKTLFLVSFLFVLNLELWMIAISFLQNLKPHSLSSKENASSIKHG
jgi:hypothetical protein